MKSLICFLLFASVALAGSPVTMNSGNIYSGSGGSPIGTFTTSGNGSVLNTSAYGEDTWDWDSQTGYYYNRYHIYDYLVTTCIQSGIDGCFRWSFEHWVLVGTEWLKIGSGEFRHPNL